MTINFGADISGGETIRPIASSAIVMQSATRKTPLISAPRISALCHPYELAADEGEVASLMVYKATRSERTSLEVSLVQVLGTATYLSIWNESAMSAKEPTE
jgi:hypothetical protein